MSMGMDRVLLDRDPMLAAAMLAHGADWRPDLQALTQLRRDDGRRLPGIELRTLEHRLEWPAGTGRAVFHVEWKESREPYGPRTTNWVARFHMMPLPETIALAVTGRTLDTVIDAEGADAWRVDEVETVPGFSSTLKLSRVNAVN